MSQNQILPKVAIRTATEKDIPGILRVLKSVYPTMSPWSSKEIRSQLRAFPEAQLVAHENGKIIGYSSSLKISSNLAFQPHNWNDITGVGRATTHDSNGDYLYGIEFAMDPDYRKRGLATRFYDRRKRICANLKLKGIIIGARLQNLAENIDKVKDPEEYLHKVLRKEIVDETLSFQFHRGFEVIMILKDYIPEDKSSAGYAALMVWFNPEVTAERPKTIVKFEGVRRSHVVSDFVRVVVAQFKQYQIKTFDDFYRHVKYFVETASGYRADFLLFPELFTMQLVTISPEVLCEKEDIVHLASFTEEFKTMMSKFAVEHRVNIIGGSHPMRLNGSVENIAYVFLRDGTIHKQSKIHPTPTEREWGMTGGHELNAIITDRGPIGVLICYDSEFPELVRHLVDQGIYMLFVPFCTDERRGYLRVRYCCQARAVENQLYVAIAGNVGNLPDTNNMNINYAQSCILTPCDYPFSWDGIAADTTPNVEGIAISDLNIKALISTRNTGGTVMHLKDRRSDLYKLHWFPKKST